MLKDQFFYKIASSGLALSYGDVRLKTGYSDVMPDEVDLNSKFSRNIRLKIPIISAAMDTVTEHKMAIALAKEGGLGIIHKNLSIEQQALEVIRVKYHLNGMIDKPICVNENDTLEEIIRRQKEKGWTFNSFPVINSLGKLVGILTKNDFEFCQNYNAPAQEIMTRDVITAGLNTTVDEAYNIMILRKKKALPIIDQSGNVIGLYTFSDVHRIKCGTLSQYNTDDKGQLIVGAAIGVGEEALLRAQKLIEKNVDVLVIDTAHGDSKKVLETLREIKKSYPLIDVVAGNISEPDSAIRLIEAGVDGLKIGQGPGSICTTRIIAGIGAPQVTAVYNCAKAAEISGIPICADGGLTYSGDIPIAIGAGAHSVMMGGMLAGTEEAPGETIFWQNRQWKSYRGMGSMAAMEEFKGSRERYGQTKTTKNDIVPEGVEGLVPYKGTLKQVITQYVGGLSRGMGYVGAKNIFELQQKADFHLISSCGQNESHPHNIEITKEAPNYSPIR